MYIRRTTRKNKNGTTATYAQVARNYRAEDGKVRHQSILNLGRIDSDEAMKQLESLAQSLLSACKNFEVYKVSEDIKAKTTKELGPSVVFNKIYRDIGFEEILNYSLSNVSTQFNVPSALFNMMLNRLTAPSSKRRMSLWEKDIEGIGSFSTHQYYRALDYLMDHKDEIEQNIFFGVKDLFHQELDVVLFDTTTLVHYGKSGEKDEDGNKPEDEQLLDYGFSKARRSDLKQVVVGVLMSKEGIPLGHEVFSGNTNDVTCFKLILDKIKEKYSLSQVVMVGDRGMISKKNIAQLEEQKLKYILGYRMRTFKKDERKDFLGKVNLRRLKNHSLKHKTIEYDKMKLVVCYNEERAILDKEFREREIKKLKEKLKSGKNVRQLISNPKHRKFLKLSNEDTVVKIDEKKIKEDEIYDGVFVISTNTSLSAIQVVERYKDLWQIEAAFRSLKSELEMGPIYHFKDRRIRAHIMICFMAFCMKVHLYKKLQPYFKKLKKSFSITELMSDLKKLRTIYMKFNGKSVKLRTELESGASHTFKALKMRPPNRILDDQLSKEGKTVVLHF